ncbi:SpoIIAA family protein [Pontibacter rugosus]|uniref:STAS/SEC14 domain-containing protein n=1 Tax=Pontibacter rugosus TaxID=1745966 RepID=A0ABW3SVL2_9BACT
MVEIIWHQRLETDEFRIGSNKVLEIVQQQGSAHLLIDARKLGPFKAEDQGWLKEVIFPQITKLSLIKIARVIGSDLFTQIILSNLMHHVHSQLQVELEMETFYSREEALEWLFED